MIYEKDSFDYWNGEPPENFLTVLRPGALDVGRPFHLIFFAPFDHPLLDPGPVCATYPASIESQILAPTRRERTTDVYGPPSVRVFQQANSMFKHLQNGNLTLSLSGRKEYHSSPPNMRDRDGVTNLLLLLLEEMVPLRSGLFTTVHVLKWTINLMACYRHFNDGKKKKKKKKKKKTG